MGDLSQRVRRLTGAVDDLRSRAAKDHEPAAAPPDAAVLRRLEAVEQALQDLVLELRAAGREPEPAAPQDARDGDARVGDARVELDDPFGLLAREPAPPERNGRER